MKNSSQSEKTIDIFNFDGVEVKFLNNKNYNITPERISAVFLVGFVKNQVITTKNERGWDIPGGHVESTDRHLLDALSREALEEAGIVVYSAVPYAIMNINNNRQSMLFFVSRDFKIGNFVDGQDVFERKLMSAADFLNKYYWNKDIMKLLIDRALTLYP